VQAIAVKIYGQARNRRYPCPPTTQRRIVQAIKHGACTYFRATTKIVGQAKGMFLAKTTPHISTYM